MSKPALVMIDVQNGIDDAAHWGGNRNNPRAEENIEKLLKHWRLQSAPVVIVQHDSVENTSPFRPGQSGNKLKAFIDQRDGDLLIRKSTASAFTGTELNQFLHQLGIRKLVIVGFVTNNSVESTARNAGDLGYQVTVVADATACFDKIGLDGQHYPSALIHQMSLSNLAGEYATILNTTAVLEQKSEYL